MKNTRGDFGGIGLNSPQSADGGGRSAQAIVTIRDVTAQQSGPRIQALAKRAGRLVGLIVRADGNQHIDRGVRARGGAISLRCWTDRAGRQPAQEVLDGFPRQSWRRRTARRFLRSFRRSG
jgi:hypothetical protein